MNRTTDGGGRRPGTRREVARCESWIHFLQGVSWVWAAGRGWGGWVNEWPLCSILFSLYLVELHFFPLYSSQWCAVNRLLTLRKNTFMTHLLDTSLWWEQLGEIRSPWFSLFLPWVSSSLERKGGICDSAHLLCGSCSVIGWGICRFHRSRVEPWRKWVGVEP